MYGVTCVPPAQTQPHSLEGVGRMPVTVTMTLLLKLYVGTCLLGCVGAFTTVAIQRNSIESRRTTCDNRMDAAFCDRKSTSTTSSPHRGLRSKTACRGGGSAVGKLSMSEMEEDYPSDTGDDRFSAVANLVENTRSAFTATDTPEVARLKIDLLRMAALTGRGQLATPGERNRVEDIIWELEMRTPITSTAVSEELEGRWALAYASEDATRSSPFFWAFRKATESLKTPFGSDKSGSVNVAARIFAITDSIPGKSVGEAVQTITADQIKSEVEIFAGAGAGSDKQSSDGPPTFPSFRSVMTTTSDITSASGTETKLRVVKTQVRKSALGRLLKPLFNLDDVEFPTETLLSPLKEGSNEVTMTTTFLDGLLRVSRNEQGQVFVFVREDEGQLR